MLLEDKKTILPRHYAYNQFAKGKQNSYIVLVVCLVGFTLRQSLTLQPWLSCSFFLCRPDWLHRGTSQGSSCLCLREGILRIAILFTCQQVWTDLIMLKSVRNPGNVPGLRWEWQSSVTEQLTGQVATSLGLIFFHLR